MGWASAGGIFGPVCEEIIKAHINPVSKKKILVALIDTLQTNDWDTEGESLDEFAKDAVVVAAFGECGVYLWGTPEYDEAYGENSVEEKARQTAEPTMYCACTGMCGGFGCMSEEGKAYMEGQRDL